MATRYVWNGASGSADGSSWANAHLSVSSAITASTAGDVFMVAHDHAETFTSSTVLTFKGTLAAPDTVYSINRSSGLYAQGAKLSVTGAFNLTINGYVAIYGFLWSLAYGSSSTSLFICNIGVKLTNSVAAFSTSGSSLCRFASVELDDFTVVPNHASYAGELSGSFSWKNSVVHASSAAGFTGVSGGILCAANSGGLINITNCDLSSLTRIANQSAGIIHYKVSNCLLPSSLAITFTARNNQLDIFSSNIQGGPSRTERVNSSGTVNIERTAVRTNGAADLEGNISLKMVGTTGYANRAFPLETYEYCQNLKAGEVGVARTFTFHVLSSATLSSGDLSVELSYLNDTNSPKTVSIDTAPLTIVNNTTALADDSASAWTTTGVSTPVKQKLTVTCTPVKAGDVRFLFRLATGATVYICPKVDIS